MTKTSTTAPTVGSIIYSAKTGETATVTRRLPLRYGGWLVYYETLEGRTSDYNPEGNVLDWAVVEHHDDNLTAHYAEIIAAAMSTDLTPTPVKDPR